VSPEEIEMRPGPSSRVRLGAITVATVLLGISWSFALFQIRTSFYPVIWAAAMPFLAFYYASGSWRAGSWRYLPAATLSIYAVVLWQVSHSYGLSGSASAVLGVCAAAVAFWLGGRLAPRRGQQALTHTPAVAPAALGSGVARRRRLRTQAMRR